MAGRGREVGKERIRWRGRGGLAGEGGGGVGGREGRTGVGERRGRRTGRGG